jgi:type 1 glutamine amidotransferase
MRDNMRLRRTVVSLFAFAMFAGNAIAEPPLRVHALSGSEEYKSDESLGLWRDRLVKEHGIVWTISSAPDRAESVDGLEHMATADVLVVFCRRWELRDDQAVLIRAWIDAGKPIIGIRTASHAFQFFQEFDRSVLGGDYSGHGPGGVQVRVAIESASSTHPVIAGVAEWERIEKLYHNRNPAGDITVLLSSVTGGQEEPLAWVRTSGGRRVFYTSMGLPDDFRNENFLRLLDNALFWAAGR